jgi:hypothetical protein
MTRRQGLAAVLALGCTLGVARIGAHHSLAAEFDVSRTVTVTGTITQMRWTNPHSWLHVDVKNARGQMEKWEIEFASPNSLYRRGWRRTDLPPKSTVTVVGYPSLDKSAKVMTATDVKLADGRTLFAGAPTSGTHLGGGG